MLVACPLAFPRFDMTTRKALGAALTTPVAQTPHFSVHLCVLFVGVSWHGCGALCVRATGSPTRGQVQCNFTRAGDWAGAHYAATASCSTAMTQHVCG